MNKILFLLIFIILIVLVISAKRYFGGEDIPGVLLKKHTVCLTEYYILKVDNENIKEKLKSAIQYHDYKFAEGIKSKDELEIKLDERFYVFADKDYPIEDFKATTWEELGLSNKVEILEKIAEILDTTVNSFPDNIKKSNIKNLITYYDNLRSCEQQQILSILKELISKQENYNYITYSYKELIKITEDINNLIELKKSSESKYTENEIYKNYKYNNIVDIENRIKSLAEGIAQFNLHILPVSESYNIVTETPKINSKVKVLFNALNGKNKILKPISATYNENPIDNFDKGYYEGVSYYSFIFVPTEDYNYIKIHFAIPDSDKITEKEFTVLANNLNI